MAHRPPHRSFHASLRTISHVGIFSNWRRRADDHTDAARSSDDAQDLVSAAHSRSGIDNESRTPSQTDHDHSHEGRDTDTNASTTHRSGGEGTDDTIAEILSDTGSVGSRYPSISSPLSDTPANTSPTQSIDIHHNDDSSHTKTAETASALSQQMLADPLVGMLIDDRYRVNQLLARGGMATVYIARDERLDRLVAIKVMHPHLAASDNFVQRFRREARAAARIIHPSVVSVFDQGVVAGSGYLVMELVDGPNLRSILNREGALPLGRALAYTESILHALSLAHRTGVIHRDIKPENVLVPADGPVKVADFGLARAASDVSAATTGSVLGTVAYIAPELVTEGEPDARTDLYALGIMLFELLTGHTPHEDRTAMQVAWAHVHEDIPAPSTIEKWIPTEVDEFVCALTARDPADRPHDAQAALDQLVRLRAELSDTLLAQRSDVGPKDAHDLTDQIRLRGETVALPVSERSSQRIKTKAPTHKKKRRTPLLIATVLTLLVAAGGAFSWWWFEYGPGSYIPVPQVVGVASEDAIETLKALNLAVQRDDAFDDEVPVNIVISTVPGPNEKVHKNGTVTLVVSKGVEMIEVPDLIGTDGSTFADTVTEAKLTPGTVTEEYSETVEKGLIISTDPSPGQSIKHHSTVSAVVSKGREPITIPNVVGISEDEASTTLTDLGLQVSTTEEFSDDVAAGVVISQDPVADETRYRSDSVSLVVSKGPEMTTVPNVVRMTEDEAVAELEARGLVVNIERVFAQFGRVVMVEPGVGTEVKVGSTVTIRMV